MLKVNYKSDLAPAEGIMLGIVLGLLCWVAVIKLASWLVG